ncbi:MAG: hypothetical protein AAGJ10_10250 [Bacteroidota bacterium]
MAEIDLQIRPDKRFDIIDLTRFIDSELHQSLASYRKVLYCSHHTTAGFVDQRMVQRFRHDRETVEAYVRSHKALFPAGADYRHDQLDERLELSEEQRCVEPRNGDSHLTFISSGLRNCVTYDQHADHPVYLVELDGVNEDRPRTRTTTIIGYDHEEQVIETQIEVPVSAHRIDSVNLRDEGLGIYDQLNNILAAYGVQKGRIDISLAREEEQAGLTVNEFETLLMRHDVRDVLEGPMRFIAERGKSILRDPRNIPSRAKAYAKYDFVRVLHGLMNRLNLSESYVERAIERMMAVPAKHFLSMKRDVSLLVSDRNIPGKGEILNGRYQSPILIQWGRKPTQQRRLNVRILRFD